MSIDKVEVMNPQGDLLTLSLEDNSNGYIVKDIGGLDPVKATIVTSNFATIPGQQRQSSNREVRNITFKLGYAPNFSEGQTIRALRSHLYEFFLTEQFVDLKFYMTDGLVVTISGQVETAEAPLFAQEPQIDISILCFNPDFLDINLTELHSTFFTTDTSPSIINVPGNIKTGLTSLKFTAAKALTDFTIYHTTPAGVLNMMQISASIQLNDVIEICTIPLQKSITLTRLGVTTSLLYAVSPQSDWILLERGANQFYLNASTTNPSAVWVDFRNRYGGL